MFKLKLKLIMNLPSAWQRSAKEGKAEKTLPQDLTLLSALRTGYVLQPSPLVILAALAGGVCLVIPLLKVCA